MLAFKWRVSSLRYCPGSKNDLEEPEVDDLLEKITDKVNVPAVAIMKDDITVKDDQLLKDKTVPNQYPYFLVIRVSNSSLSIILITQLFEGEKMTKTPSTIHSFPVK